MRPLNRHRRLRAALILLAGLAVAALCGPPAARAADYAVRTNGNWTAASTWTPTGGPPGANDVAYIGSTYPTGAAGTATVLLTQNQQANTVVLGYGAGTSGTLNLGNFNLTSNALYLGFNGGTGAVTRGTGSLDVVRLQLSASDLALSASDKAWVLYLLNGSSATTAATANVSDVVRVQSGSTLTLGADLYAGAGTDSYAIEVSGANSTLDARGYKISTTALSIGWEYVNDQQVPGSHVVNFLNRGDLDVGNLYVANQTLNLTAADRVSTFYLSNGSTTFAPDVAVYSLRLQDGSIATTTAVGNITGVASVRSGSTLTLGADLVTEGVLVEGDNSTLDARGHRITATELLLGWGGGANVRLLSRGDLAVTGLAVANQNFHLTATDRVTNFSLSNGNTTFIPAADVQSLYLQEGATAATSAVGNITANVGVASGSTLTLGADLSVSESVQVFGANSRINAQGHRITASYLRLEGEGGSAQLQNRGGLTVTALQVLHQTLNLGAADQVAHFSLHNASSNLGAVAGIESLDLQSGSTAVTAAAGNLTGSVTVGTGSTLTLGANLTVSGSVDVGGINSTLDARGHTITADTLALGQPGGTSVRLLNKGNLAVTNLALSGQTLDLSAADRVGNLYVGFYSDAGSNVSTVATASVTGSVDVSYNSTLTLGADLSVTGAVRVGSSNSTLDARGHNITADSLDLGWGTGGANVRLLNRGNLAVTNLRVNQDFNLTPADRVTNFSLIYGKTNLGAGVGLERLTVADIATATTSAAGNVTKSVLVTNVLEDVGSRLTLGADLTLSEHLNAYGHTVTIDARGHNITAGSLSFEYAPGNPGLPNIRLLNDGAVTVNGPLSLVGGAKLELRDGNDTAQSLWMDKDSGLRIKSAATGLTITGTAADDLWFIDTSTLTLELDGSRPGWVLRWANPAGGDHVADLSALIAQGSIVFDVTNGGQFSLVSQNGYTYIVQPVPEPGLILLLAAPVAVSLCRGRSPKKGTSCTAQSQVTS